jgi:hypothetical protein
VVERGKWGGCGGLRSARSVVFREWEGEGEG